MSKHPFLLIFLLSAALGAWVQATPGFGDPDAYYHLEMARRTAASGPVLEFPWLPLTTLSDHFADHHFLYHLALIPFIGAFGDFLGLKIATVSFAALAAVAFLFLLKEYGARRPFLWTMVLLFASGFVSRLLLTKATALALAAFFLFLAALRRRNRLAVFGISFMYVWLHGGWPILLIAAFLHAAVNTSFLHVREKATHWKSFMAAGAGLVAGLIINPFFPGNLRFYWEQIVQIAVLGRGDQLVAVGAEWYPSEFGTLLLDDTSIFLPLAVGVAAFIAAIWTRQVARAGAAPDAERRRDIAFVSALSLVFLLMTLRQARHKEYFLPVMLIFGALIAETAFGAVDLQELLSRTRSRLGRVFLPSIIALIIASVVFGAHALWVTHAAYAYRESNAWSRFADVGAWTRSHVPAGEMLFHQRWDDFPQLWYRDPDHRYIAGLDALFFYRKDPEKYWLWRDISEGRRREGLAELIEKEFSARYVILRMGPDPLRALMKKDPSFERVYADIEAEVWRIR